MRKRNNLGFITNEITMSLGDGLVLGSAVPLGYITPNITTMLGEPPEQDAGSGKIVFWTLTFGLGMALGAALGIAHGVKIARAT